MDTEDSSEGELRLTFRELAAINRYLGGHAVTLNALASLIPRGTKNLRILDVGCGDGQTACLIQDWAASRGIAAEVCAIDLSAASVRLAEERNRKGLSFVTGNLFSLREGDVYDIVHAGLMLHHCPEHVAVRALQAMYARAWLGVIINDLHRHKLAYHAIKIMTAAFSRNRLIRHDGPLSVLRGFRRAELVSLCRQADLPAPDIRWRWAFRWQMVIRR